MQLPVVADTNVGSLDGRNDRFNGVENMWTQQKCLGTLEFLGIYKKCEVCTV
jgi:hypothetical protein